METTKRWYMSRTIWASLVTVLLSLAGAAGLPVAGIDGGALAEAIVQAATALFGVVAILARLKATTKLG